MLNGQFCQTFSCTIQFVINTVDVAQSALAFTQDLTGIIFYNLTSNGCKEQKKIARCKPAFLTSTANVEVTISLSHSLF